MSLPLLYSFRRCPYAIRARMALFYSDIQIDI
ncbi:MAG: glutathione S-transferase, partial [Gammaproteobacteria bacterium]|nr:glutathione S-transferase [Gammaproteobacteria bacterium]